MQLLGPGDQLGGFPINAMIEIDRADVGVLEHVADAIGHAGFDSRDRIGIRVVGTMPFAMGKKKPRTGTPRGWQSGLPVVLD